MEPKYLSALLRDDSGQGVLEYTLIICFVTVVVLVSLRVFGAKTNNTLYEPTVNALNNTP
jgi:Flp pilus assembly pilin Flp